jgi:CRP-like cAMP-binding protein
VRAFVTGDVLGGFELIRQVPTRLFTVKATRDSRMISIPTVHYLKYLATEYTEHINLLHQLPVFSELSKLSTTIVQENVLAQFYLGGTRKKFIPGQMIVKQGSPCPDLHVILSGEVLMVMNSDKKKQPVALLGTRSCFGYVADNMTISISNGGSVTEMLILAKHLLKRICSKPSLVILKEEMLLQQEFMQVRMTMIRQMFAREKCASEKRHALLDLGEKETSFDDAADSDSDRVEERRGILTTTETTKKTEMQITTVLTSTPRRREMTTQRPMSSAGRRSETKYGKWSSMTMTMSPVSANLQQRATKVQQREATPQQQQQQQQQQQRSSRRPASSSSRYGSSTFHQHTPVITVLPPSPALLGSTGSPRRRSIFHAVKTRKKTPLRPKVVSDCRRSISTRQSIHNNIDRIERLGVSPRVQRHLYKARSIRQKLEELKKRRREATKSLDDADKLAGYPHENLGSLKLY